MSPRFERRPEKRTGTGGRGRRFGADPERSGEQDRRGRAAGPFRVRPRRAEEERPLGGGRGSGRGGARPDSPRRSGDSRSDWGERPRAERGRGRTPERRSPMPRFVRPRPRSNEAAPVDRDRPLPLADGDREFAERHGEDQPSDLIWGRHAAAAALENGRPVHRIWCTTELRFRPPFLQALREAKAAGVLVEEVTWARLGQITAGAVHQGIVLQPAAADTLDLASLIEGCRELGEPPLLMALDGITDPHNLGAIARSAEALGAHGLVLPQRRSAGLTGSVAKVAAGALEHLPVARVVNLNRALDSLRQEGYRVVGLAAEGSVNLPEADLEGPLVIVTGSEGDGLSMLTRRHCDTLVRIPLRGATPSLNASVATAMVLYEVARRGWMKDLRGGQPAPRLQRPRLAAAAADPAAADPAAADFAAADPAAGSTAAEDLASAHFAAGEPDRAPEAGTMG